MASRPVPRIFVVDNEYVIASTLAVILDINGFSARVFTQPGEAFAAAQEDPPDLLVSEVAMPGLSGIDLAIRIKALHPRCKILLFSGQVGALDLLEDARRRGHHFRLLVKPVLPVELLSELETLRGRVQPPPRGYANAGLRLVRSRRTSSVEGLPGKDTRKVHLVKKGEPNSFRPHSSPGGFHDVH
jgi:DNA-binding response OmpR family regulator